MTTLQTLLANSTYTSYSYAYPHKTAYRPLNPPAHLSTVWAQENKSALFLYLHIPFCEMRCGFCNLFTQTNAGKDLVSEYLKTLTREATQVKAALGDSQFARMAIGGGTPTFLNVPELERVFDLAADIMGANLHQIPISVEVSPQTATTEKLTLLKQRGVDRVSIGIQSFIPAETAAAGRPQTLDNVYAALDRIHSVGFPTLNLDLIYGLPGQSIDSWLKSLQIALKFAPEELYLYPLYIRPLTGLERSRREWNDERRDYYRHARDFLLASGYEQVSMRMFRSRHAPNLDAPVYCCQADGMVGLGCGARSYTSSLHYSSEYAVGMTGIQEIIANYTKQEDDSPGETLRERFNWVNYGYQLDLDDRQRRFLIQSLLQSEGLDLNDYQQTFHTDALTDFPQLNDLLTLELATWEVGEGETGSNPKSSINPPPKIPLGALPWSGNPTGAHPQNPKSKIILTPAGVEVSDTLGVWLYSPQVKSLMEDYQWR
ncbi:STM4012 family radical SAM protein [Chamaesiphon minutus]|uniref:Heme chaperone HemW n=1 Tax=Chamaesiphon minutus (strain ATCC 27169 / PCC 6605) TaxID=1173020 RepID=K9UBX1_CHAP6|nr:STM4012 family radical SAM protein [Chamaesiphon minutus]AFY92305.1 Fe-S oxidoreductase, coproporphyrinogen III oxidase [Chamaesiphon minutus PCC 6605]